MVTVFTNASCTMVFALSLFGCGSGGVAVIEGDQAPDFVLKSQDGQDVRLSDFEGKSSVVLYFYPKDGTPGCTKEACSFRDFNEEFKKAGAVILGVSVDDVDSHKEFHQEHSLNFTLLADPDKVVTRQYGVLGPFGWARRVTFVVDNQRTIRKIFRDVDVSVHSEEVLELLREAK